MAKGKPTITKPAQKPKPPPQAKPAEEKTLADCRRARHDYFILETLTAGMVLQGWEVKSARAGRAQINESYVIVSRAEVFLLGSHFSPLTTTSTHTEADTARSRKLLLNAKEIDRLQGKTKQAGLTIVPGRECIGCARALNDESLFSRAFGNIRVLLQDCRLCPRLRLAILICLMHV